MPKPKPITIVAYTVIICIAVTFCTGTSIFLFQDKTNLQTILTPTWRGITPGETTKQQVIQLMGKPDSVIGCQISIDSWQEGRNDLQDCLSQVETYEYNQVYVAGKAPSTHEIRFKQDIVWVIVEDTFRRPDYDQLSVEKFVEQYGLPEKVTWSGLYHYRRAVLFCKHGIMLHAYDGGVDWILYFTPMPLNECLREFRRYIPTQRPAYPPDVISAPEDPWGFDKQR